MALTQLNIEELVALCIAKNSKAQLEIYNRYYKAMYNSAYRILKNKMEAEDIMQDAFLTAFTKLETLNDRNTFGAWLKRIVVNKSIYQFNKNKSNNAFSINPILYQIEDPETNKIENSNYLNNLQAKQILHAMQELNNNYSTILSLHFIEGYDYEEICSILNITNVNCRTILSRAKNSLRKKLEALKETKAV